MSLRMFFIFLTNFNKTLFYFVI